MTPGSEEAIKNGCTCDPQHNHRGRGFAAPGREPIFWKHEDCPLHGINNYLERHKNENSKRP